MRSRLELFDPKFADQIWSIKNNATLRLFACKCAHLAFSYCGNGDQRSLKALEIGSRYAKSEANDDDLNLAYLNAESAAEAADEIAFDARNALNLGEVSKNEYEKLFSAARAAYSAQECCSKDAMEAAHEAVYEAWSALSTAIKAGSTLDGLVSSNSNDTTIVSIFRDILLKLDSEE